MPTASRLGSALVARRGDRIVEEAHGQIDMDAGAVAGLAIGIDRAAMPHRLQRIDRRLRRRGATACRRSRRRGRRRRHRPRIRGGTCPRRRGGRVRFSHHGAVILVVEAWRRHPVSATSAGDQLIARIVAMRSITAGSVMISIGSAPHSCAGRRREEAVEFDQLRRRERASHRRRDIGPDIRLASIRQVDHHAIAASSHACAIEAHRRSHDLRASRLRA